MLKLIHLGKTFNYIRRHLPDFLFKNFPHLITWSLVPFSLDNPVSLWRGSVTVPAAAVVGRQRPGLWSRGGGGLALARGHPAAAGDSPRGEGRAPQRERCGPLPSWAPPTAGSAVGIRSLILRTGRGPAQGPVGRDAWATEPGACAEGTTACRCSESGASAQEELWELHLLTP